MVARTRNTTAQTSSNDWPILKKLQDKKKFPAAKAINGANGLACDHNTDVDTMPTMSTPLRNKDSLNPCLKSCLSFLFSPLKEIHPRIDSRVD